MRNECRQRRKETQGLSHAVVGKRGDVKSSQRCPEEGRGETVPLGQRPLRAQGKMKTKHTQWF